MARLRSKDVKHRNVLSMALRDTWKGTVLQWSIISLSEYICLWSSVEPDYQGIIWTHENKTSKSSIMWNHLVWIMWQWRGIAANSAMVMSLPLQCFLMDFSSELDRGTRCDGNSWIMNCWNDVKRVVRKMEAINREDRAQLVVASMGQYCSLTCVLHR